MNPTFASSFAHQCRSGLSHSWACLNARRLSAATRLHGHRAGRERGQERQKLAAAQLLAKDHRPRAVSPMELTHVLGPIESDGANLVHERLLEWALIRGPGDGLGLRIPGLLNNG